jgi:hypothetical protein
MSAYGFHGFHNFQLSFCEENLNKVSARFYKIIVNRKKGFVSSVGNQTCKKPAEIRIKSKEKEVN